MEYGLDESFPIYSGGLGVLAGDILKTAHDLQFPYVGIGILWHEGYSEQYLDQDGFPPCHSRQEYDRSHLEDIGGYDRALDPRRTGGLQGLENGGFWQCAPPLSFRR